MSNSDLIVPVLKTRPDCAPQLVDVAASRHNEPQSSEVVDASKTSRIFGIQRITVVGEQWAGEDGWISLHKSLYSLEIPQGIWCQTDMDQLQFV